MRALAHVALALLTLLAVAQGLHFSRLFPPTISSATS